MAHLSDPLENPISTSDQQTSSELRTLHSIKHMLHLRDGVLTYVPELNEIMRIMRIMRHEIKKPNDKVNKTI